MSVRILTGDAVTMLRDLPDASVNCCVTSPPYYGLRDYGMDGQIGLEETPDAFVARLVDVFREVRRVVRDDGTLWLNIGDSYAGGYKVKEPDATPAGSVVDVRSGVTAGETAHKFRAGNPDKNKGNSNRDGLGRVVGFKPKDLIGVPWLLAFALRADGWYLRQDIIWHKPNPMPESVTDRCTKSHEYVFLLAKSSRYFYDAVAIQEPFVYDGDVRMKTAYAVGTEKRVGSEYRAPVNQEGRNKRSVWTIATQPFSEAHFATMAPELAETCIKAGCPKGGTVLDPFGGAGTTGLCADRLGRNAILIELNPAYVEIARKRLTNDAGMFAEVAA